MRERTGPALERDSLDRLGVADLARAMELVAAVGWNQTSEDWGMMLRLGEGWGIRTAKGELVATSVLFGYPPDVGWISMVIVDAMHRGRGLATRLLANGIARFEERGFTPTLDATPAGRPVYAGLGFFEYATVSRWRGLGAGKGRPLPSGADVSPGAIGAARAAWGHDSSAVLGDIARRGGVRALPGNRAWLWWRPGRTATHLGPLITETNEQARALCEWALTEFAGPILIDVPDSQVELAEFISLRGLRRERGFHRMQKGQASGSPLDVGLRATAGPELG